MTARDTCDPVQQLIREEEVERTCSTGGCDEKLQKDRFATCVLAKAGQRSRGMLGVLVQVYPHHCRCAALVLVHGRPRSRPYRSSVTFTVGGSKVMFELLQQFGEELLKLFQLVGHQQDVVEWNQPEERTVKRFHSCRGSSSCPCGVCVRNITDLRNRLVCPD